jgi:hypothetical protein
MRFPQAIRKRAPVILGALLLGGLALSAARWGHLNALSQGSGASPRPHSVDLKWNASPSRDVRYNVYRSEKAGGPYSKLTPDPVLGTTYTDRTVQSGHSYFYRVTAVNNQGHESAFSTQIKVVVPSP